MTLRHKIKDPLAEINRSQQEEIKRYKWIESEKLGKDIGWEQARQEWLAKHFPAWKQDRWQRAIREAETTGISLN